MVVQNHTIYHNHNAWECPTRGFQAHLDTSVQPQLNSGAHVNELCIHCYDASSISRLFQTCQSMLCDLDQILHTQYQPNPNHHYCTAAISIDSSINVNVCNNEHDLHANTQNNSSCVTDPASHINICSNLSTLHSEYSRRIPQSVPAYNRCMHLDSGHSTNSPSVETSNGYREPITQLPWYTNNDISQVVCYRCQAHGHYALHCPTRLHSSRYIPLDLRKQPPKFRRRIWRRSAQHGAQSSALWQSSEPIPVSRDPANHISPVNRSTHVLARARAFHNNYN